MDEKQERKLPRTIRVDVRNRTFHVVEDEPVQVRRVVEEDKVGFKERVKELASALVILAVFYLFVVVVFSF